jgi:hypothetical protein
MLLLASAALPSLATPASRSLMAPAPVDPTWRARPACVHVRPAAFCSSAWCINKRLGDQAGGKHARDLKPAFPDFWFGNCVLPSFAFITRDYGATCCPTAFPSIWVSSTCCAWL